MSVSVSDIQTRFPEFTNTDATLIQQCINDAVDMVNAEVFGTKTDMAVRYKAAHLIAVNPAFGEQARLDKKMDATVYSTEYERIKRSVASGYRVI